MSDDLYQGRMMELARQEDGRLDAPDASVTLDNPLCGDRVTIDLRRDASDRIVELGHTVRGCVLCRAAATVLGEHAEGQDAAALAAVRAGLRAHLRREGERPADPRWADLAVFDAVAPHKSRHECVLLPFEAVLEALGRD